MKHIVYYAECECGWRSKEHTSIAAAQREAKQHYNDNPHRELDIDELF